MIMGTSTCHMVLGAERAAGRGDVRRRRGRHPARASSATRPASPAWATSSPGSSRTACPPAYARSIAPQGVDLHTLLEARGGEAAARRDRAARARLVERQPLRPRRRRPDRAAARRDARDASREEIYRALIEATAFGTRVIIDAFERNGVAVNEIVACGGLPERNALLMQIYADVTGREFKVERLRPDAARSARRCSAPWPPGATAAATTRSTTPRARMARVKDETFKPDPGAPRRLRRALSPSTRASTTTSAAARTT